MVMLSLDPPMGELPPKIKDRHRWIATGAFRVPEATVRLIVQGRLQEAWGTDCAGFTGSTPEHDGRKR